MIPPLDEHNRFKNILLKIIKKHLPNSKVYLFGSRASKTNTPHSDIDLAIDNLKEIETSIIGTIIDEIEESTVPFFVDVVDVYGVNKTMREQILKHGKLWKN
jgi:hypothetical protein